jgi:hypothetical protein
MPNGAGLAILGATSTSCGQADLATKSDGMLAAMHHMQAACA